MALFENYEGRMPQLQPVLEKYGFKDFDELKAYNNSKGVDAYKIVEGIQPICFENAKWAYELGAAIALKKGVKTAAEAATCIGEGLQAFCIPGSVADQRQVGLGHGNLGAMLLDEKTECFAFLAGHESFAAAEGAIGPQCQQGSQEPPARHPERSGQGRCHDHQPHQRLHLCADQV